MRVLVHYLAGGFAIAAVLTFVGCLAASQQYVDPDRSTDWLTTALLPPDRPSDFVGPGWRFRVAAYVALVVAFLSAGLWGSTG
jgi:hypothetical protein